MDQPLRQSLRSSIRNRRNLAMQEIDTYSDVHRARDVDHAGINERLYQAFNELHALAQDFGKDFDAPSILVVGHQTDGKSALVEALMGFQFNHVGGGTKTRRPIALHMRYNPAAAVPICHLLPEAGCEREVTLQQLQDYIQAENQALEEVGAFECKEIVVRMEYKYCPNLTIIDTPGLISAAPGKANGALQASARQVEGLIRAKASCPDYIILCLEDTADWNNATTRRIVMEVDPTLGRTVLVSTKLDTRIPQFSTPSDVDTFLRAAGAASGTGDLLGGLPFFTSVPSGRVGPGSECVWRDNEAWRGALAAREERDVAELEAKMGRRLTAREASHVGVQQLRGFLEELLLRRYLDTVPGIVPLLEQEARGVGGRLEAARRRLDSLSLDKLKEHGRSFREAFLSKLALLLAGTMAAPVEHWGETLADEHVQGGAFVDQDGNPLPLPAALPNADMRLFGGAQFHRALAEFRLAVGQVSCPAVSREEIVNACGMEPTHDGVNYMRTACVIAVARARQLLEPYIHQLGYRLAHILKRLWHISLDLLQRDGLALGGAGRYLGRLAEAYDAFLGQSEASCKARCLEDLASTTRYVTWSLHTRSTAALRSTLLTKLQLADMLRPGGPGAAHPAPASGKGGAGGSGPGGGLVSGDVAAGVMLDLLEGTLWQRQLGSLSEELVSALVGQVFDGIRDHLLQAAELKFNVFFLLPLVDAFPDALRNTTEAAWEGDVEEVFDVGAVRSATEAQLRALDAEKVQVQQLQRKFSQIHATLVHQAGGVATPKHPQEAATLGATTSSLAAAHPPHHQGRAGLGGGLVDSTALSASAWGGVRSYSHTPLAQSRCWTPLKVGGGAVAGAGGVSARLAAAAMGGGGNVGGGGRAGDHHDVGEEGGVGGGGGGPLQQGLMQLDALVATAPGSHHHQQQQQGGDGSRPPSGGSTTSEAPAASHSGGRSTAGAPSVPSSSNRGQGAVGKPSSSSTAAAAAASNVNLIKAAVAAAGVGAPGRSTSPPLAGERGTRGAPGSTSDRVTGGGLASGKGGLALDADMTPLASSRTNAGGGAAAAGGGGGNGGGGVRAPLRGAQGGPQAHMLVATPR